MNQNKTKKKRRHILLETFYFSLLISIVAVQCSEEPQEPTVQPKIPVDTIVQTPVLPTEPDSVSMTDIPTDTASTDSKPEHWKAIVVFNPNEEVSEDWNFAFGEIMDAFYESGVLVEYVSGPEMNIVIKGDTVFSESMVAYYTQFGQGYLLLKAGKDPYYIGDHGLFHTGSDQDNPIRQARDYFGMSELIY